jgi:hypothetical protein
MELLRVFTAHSELPTHFHVANTDPRCSSLECQLNTLGVRGALHESVIGRSVALAKYAAAARGGNTRMAPPPWYNTTDVFS